MTATSPVGERRGRRSPPSETAAWTGFVHDRMNVSGRGSPAEASRRPVGVADGDVAQVDGFLEAGADDAGERRGRPSASACSASVGSSL